MDVCACVCVEHLDRCKTSVFFLRRARRHLSCRANEAVDVDEIWTQYLVPARGDSVRLATNLDAVAQLVVTSFGDSITKMEP